MKRTRIKDLLAAAAPAQDVLVKGWVRTRRDAKDFSFLEINDGSCLGNLQVVASADALGFEGIADMGTGAAVAVSGDFIPSPGQGQAFELAAKSLTLIGPADQASYPLQKKRHSDEFLRQIAHLRPRTNKYGAVFRIRSEMALAIHRFFAERGFVCLHTPILTGSDCEGAGEMFAVHAPGDAAALPAPGPSPGQPAPAKGFFGKSAHLTVSGQLAAEPFALALGNVYTFGPTFRAEKSDTPRHAAEFWMVEPEMAFADLAEDMDLAEALIKHLVAHALGACAEDLTLFARFVDAGLMERLASFTARPFARLAYAEAMRVLSAAPKRFEHPVGFGLDLQTEHERYLAEEYVKGPLFVYDYPKDIKAFYMRANDDNLTVAAMDLLVPGIGELVGGSAREERLDRLAARLTELGLPLEEYAWYLDTRRFGSVPHAGFGLGFERLIMAVTGVSNIRDVIAYPRAYGLLEF